METKAARLAAQGQQQAKLVKRIEAELEWVRSSPKARQAKSKARLARFNEMEAEAAASKNVDFTDIKIVASFFNCLLQTDSEVIVRLIRSKQKQKMLNLTPTQCIVHGCCRLSNLLSQR